jgi:hypothetical protein
MRESSSHSPYDDLHRPIIVGLLAHSVDLGPRSRDRVIERLWRVLEEEISKRLDQPWLLSDVLCIADTVTLTLSTTVPVSDALKEAYPDAPASLSSGAIQTAYIQQLSVSEGNLQGAVSLGALIADVTERLAWNDKTLRDLAMFFSDSRISGGGFGPTNLWTSDALSPEVWERLRRDGFVEECWSRWDRQF